MRKVILHPNEARMPPTSRKNMLLRLLAKFVAPSTFVRSPSSNSSSARAGPSMVMMPTPRPSRAREARMRGKPSNKKKTILWNIS